MAKRFNLFNCFLLENQQGFPFVPVCPGSGIKPRYPSINSILKRWGPVNASNPEMCIFVQSQENQGIDRDRRVRLLICKKRGAEVWNGSYGYFFPQQLPGPAHPASPGDDPQQVVSPIPGVPFFAVPDIEECAESIFFILRLPQILHCGWSSVCVIKISFDSPQSKHK